MIKLSPLPNGPGYEAELLNLDVPASVGYCQGATEAQVLTQLREQLACYIAELQEIDFTRIVRP